MSDLILKTLAGSRAYGLEVEGSDFDYHAVFVAPTSELLSIGPKPRESVWKEGDEDFQSWELGRFLHLAVKCNPTILETLVAPIVDMHPRPMAGDGPTTGEELRALFPSVLERKRVFDAYRGYAHNQRAKLFNKPNDLAETQPGERAWKFAAQYLRILMQGERLLRTGELMLDMSMYDPARAVRAYLLDVKHGKSSMGRVIDRAAGFEEQLGIAYENSEIPEKADLGAVNDFLLRVRKESW